MRIWGKLRSNVLALAIAVSCATPLLAQDDPASLALQARFPELHDAIWSIPTVDTATKQGITALWQTAIEMAAPEVAGEALARIFGVSVTDVLAAIAADPGAAAALALDKFGEGLATDAAVAASAALLADVVLSIPVVEEFSPAFRAVLAAIIRSLVEESYFVYKGIKNPSEIVGGLVNRAFDIYEIARATGQVVDAQRSALVAAAQAVELAAQLAHDVATDDARQLAMEIVTDTQDIVAGLFGRDDAEAVREIVNLAFIALLSQRRGDAERAQAFARRLLDLGAEADNIGPFSAMLRPFDWLTAIGREDFRDAPSEAAFIMVSTTGLRFLFAPTGTEPPAATPPEVPPAPDGPVVAPEVWGPALVFSGGLGYGPCLDGREDPACLRELGLSDDAIAFAYALDGDYNGMSVGVEFLEVGAVDLAVAQVIGASIWYTPVLLNGAVGFLPLYPTRDLHAAFRDDASRDMLDRFPQASSYGIEVRSHRLLPDGTQRFAAIEMITESCHACPIVGAALTFHEVGPATGGQVLSRPIGLLLGDPDESEDMTAEVLLRRPESLQVMLNGLGYDAGMMDGYPGPQTRQALMEFQAEHCLPPTGEPDPETRAALMAATGFDAPCAGAQIPAGLSANTPLRAGMYIDDPALCQVASMTWEMMVQSTIMVGQGGGFGFFEEDCMPFRSDIRNGVTLFRGNCSFGDNEWDGQWTVDLLSSEAFLFLGPDGTDSPHAFTRCADDSPVRTGIDQVAAQYALPEGAFATDRVLCPPLSDAVIQQYGDATYFGVVTFAEGLVEQGESTCDVTAVSADGPTLNIALRCESDGGSFTTTRVLSDRREDAFVLDGETYLHCGSDNAAMATVPQPGTYASDPAFCLDPGAAVYGRDLRVVGPDTVDHGMNDPCAINPPVPDGDALEYTAHCPFNEPGFVANWRWRPESATSFIEERGFFPESSEAPWGQRFTLCAETTISETEPSGVIEAIEPGRPAWWADGLVLTGQGTQDSGSSWTIEIRVDADGSATIRYPSLGCGGQLALIGYVDGDVTLSESITENRPRCTDGGIVRIAATVDVGNYRFFWDKDGRGAEGSLRSGRDDPALAPAEPPRSALPNAAEALAVPDAGGAPALEAAAAALPGTCRTVTATIASDVSSGLPGGSGLPTCDMCELTAVEFDGPLESPGHRYDYLWRGACQNGMIHGPGVMRAFEDGRDVFEIAVSSPHSGYQVVNGRFVLDISSALVGVTLGRRGERIDDCNANPNRLDIYGIVRDGVQLQSAEIARALLDQAKNTILERCPNLVGADYEVDLLFEGDVPQIGSLDVIVVQGGRGASYARASCDGESLSRDVPCHYNGSAYARDYVAQLHEVASDRLRALEEAEQAAAIIQQESERESAIEAILGPIRRSAEQFLQTGRGSLADLAAAADMDGMATLVLLEGGISLQLPEPDGNFDLVEANGERFVQISYRRDSPLVAAERAFLAENNQSWDDWNRLLVLAVPRIIQVTCLFRSAADVPQGASEVVASLRDFSSDSSSVSIVLDCQ